MRHHVNYYHHSVYKLFACKPDDLVSASAAPKKIFDSGLADGHDRNTASTVLPDIVNASLYLPPCLAGPFGEAKTALQALKTLVNRLRCGQTHAYPQDRMCETRRFTRDRFFVQLTSPPETRLVQRFRTHVNR
jgi:hypothetical protein